MSVKEVVIIGGSYAAINAVKIILTSKEGVVVHITVIAPNKFAFNIPTVPRLLSQNQHLKDVVLDNTVTFAKYTKDSKHSLDYVQGYVVGVDLEKQRVEANVDGKSVSYTYDNLILASGSRSSHTAFKMSNSGDHTVIEDAIKLLTSEIKNASSIAVIGGGPTGVETASEIAFEFDNKKVTLFTGESRPLARLSEKLSTNATKKLRDVNVKVVNNLRSTSVKEIGNKTIVEFDDASSQEFDLVIPVFLTIPNSEYMSAYPDLLDKNGFIFTDKNLRLKGYPGVLVFGDLIQAASSTLVDLVYVQKAVLQKSIEKEILGLDVKLKDYEQPNHTMIVVPITRNGGVGTAYGFSMPNFLVRIGKAKDFFVSKTVESLG